MSSQSRQSSPAKVEQGVKEMKIENANEEVMDTIAIHATDNGGHILLDQLHEKRENSSSSRGSRDEQKETIGGDITVKIEPGQQIPKLVRSSTQSIKSREPPLFGHLQDATAEATSDFQLISECSYYPKYLGDTEHGMECDCPEEWDPVAKLNRACGDESDCINRATKIECYGDCGCGNLCQNQRFQRQQYAKVSVIRTEKKGHGLRADTDLQPGEFIYEYIGEVIHEAQFRKRMMQYDDDGIKHFYFMSLNRGEFVDATKKGNLGRFCNHSCNPNCYVDKWVVGDKLRMGIFAERRIRTGEELVFNYNVDRYGADPQPCYCGEPNCTGFIGGKTQTDSGTQLSHATIEALGIDNGDSWDTAVAKRPRKKKTSEDDEEYVNNVQPRCLDEEGVTKVMAALMQCKEKWIAVKLLERIQLCEDERVIHRIVKMHGYQILNSTLSMWKEDFNVVLQILDILNRLPRLTKNKITDSKIESTVEGLRGCGDRRVENQVSALLQVWSTLEMGYRIPRKKRDPNVASESQSRLDRRDNGRDERKARSRSRTRSRSRSRSLDAPKGPSAPTGPRNSQPQRAFVQSSRPPFRPPRPFGALPSGWFSAVSNGRTYYYNARGDTTWQRPTAPTSDPPPPPKPAPATKALDDIINEITSSKTKTPEKPSSSAGTPKATVEESQSEKKEASEKWRALSEEKQRKLYENTLFPHVKHVADRYKHKLPREDIKRFFREVTKKLVNSDYKNNRVKDPTKVSEKQERNVKKFAKEYFDKAVAKKADYDKRRAERKAQYSSKENTTDTLYIGPMKRIEDSDNDGQMDLTDDELPRDDVANNTTSPVTPLDQMGSDGLKRKRDDPDVSINRADYDETPSKKARSLTPPAPPPPPPPADRSIERRHAAEIDANDQEAFEPWSFTAEVTLADKSQASILTSHFGEGNKPSFDRGTRFDVTFKENRSFINGGNVSIEEEEASENRTSNLSSHVDGTPAK